MHLPLRGRLLPNGSFHLPLTLLCGQCFRWKKSEVEDWYEGVAGGVYWRLKQENKEIVWECSSERVRETSPSEWISGYLNLKQDLSGFEEGFRDHPILEAPIRWLRGLRLIRQEPWECAVSYLFAQSLSVRVIQKALDRFCVKFGQKIEGAPSHYAFPEPGLISGLNAVQLRPYANNNRARGQRIIKLARSLEAGVLSLPYLREIPCDEARQALMALEGIGPKIADCILLFSLDHVSAFPLDRWVLRAMKSHFPSVRFLGKLGTNPTPSQYPALVKRARKAFGLHCGLASEYLFLYLRLLDDPSLVSEFQLNNIRAVEL